MDRKRIKSLLAQWTPSKSWSNVWPVTNHAFGFQVNSSEVFGSKEEEGICDLDFSNPEVIELSTNDAKIVYDALNNPPAPNEAFIDAAQKFKDKYGC
ncbi:protein of unknown function DUF1778 [Thalassoporum mexicanum PCC 7367]|uniref:type II toxin -antitoxin system TacA 1-like antitoxin n=1 Tax=Thalassoporum mexicanum TaxID=3457544 RepID=UPI00029F9814|nr:DUF1778 domain-containing protein [Pseudanabaena sp. PCC 7367]AFY69650.1 protein of unknown function DUF1778 [Pseudanabaena sp. PCC 7367]